MKWIPCGTYPGEWNLFGADGLCIVWCLANDEGLWGIQAKGVSDKEVQYVYPTKEAAMLAAEIFIS